MMQHQGPRNGDEHVDVQNLLRSLPSVGAADGFEKNLMQRIEAENLNVAYHLTNLPKVPAVGDFNDRLHWSIAVHNQINGGVATQAASEVVLATEAAGGRLWLRAGLLLVAMAIGFGSWAAMESGTPSQAGYIAGASGNAAAAQSAGGSSAQGSHAVSGQDARSNAPAPKGSVVLSIGGNASEAAPMQSLMSPSAPQSAASRTTLPQIVIAQPAAPVRSLLLPPVTSAEKSAKVNLAPAAPQMVDPASAHVAIGVRRDTSASVTTTAEAANEPASSQPSISTGAPDQNGSDADTPTDSIHTGEHRTEDGTPLAP